MKATDKVSLFAPLLFSLFNLDEGAGRRRIKKRDFEMNPLIQCDGKSVANGPTSIIENSDWKILPI